jgi:hypothetical protein
VNVFITKETTKLLLVYSIAIDGLLFKPLAYVLPKVQSPIFAVIATTLITGFNNKK